MYFTAAVKIAAGVVVAAITVTIVRIRTMFTDIPAVRTGSRNGRIKAACATRTPRRILTTENTKKHSHIFPRTNKTS